MELSFQFLLNLLLFLLFPFIGGVLAVRYKLSPLIGYIVGGIFMGVLLNNRFPPVFLSNISMLGLSLLVFAIGMEVDFRVIKKFSRFVLIGGLLQILLTSFFLVIFSSIFGFSFMESLIFGFSLSLSSTAVVAKIIQDRGEESSFLGSITIGVLVFQDLALIPLIVIFSSFSNNASLWMIVKTVFLNMLKATVLLVLVYVIGESFVPRLMEMVADLSQEIFNLFIVLFIVASLVLFSWLGISVLLAAFIAGILLNKTLEKEHIFSQIRSIRDLLAIVFFVVLGIGINLNFVYSHLLSILLFTTVLVVIKFIVVLAIFLYLHFHTKTAFSLAAYLFEVGEGAFILVSEGLRNGVIQKSHYDFIVSVVILTLILTPFLINYKEKMYILIRRFLKKHFPYFNRLITYSFDEEIPQINVLPYRNHIVICGYGRVGSYIGRALSLAKIPFIAVDYNLQVVKKAKAQGVSIIYGDPTNIEILDYLEVDKASILISAIPNRMHQEQVILAARRLNPNIIIFTRVHSKEDQKRLRDLNVNVIVHPEFEASLSIVRKIFLLKRVPKEEIQSKIRRLKIEHGML